jgi:hypothetical protein
MGLTRLCPEKRALCYAARCQISGKAVIFAENGGMLVM